MRHTKIIKHNLVENCYEIKLTQNKWTYIDIDDYYILNDYNFCYSNAGYAKTSKDYKTLFLHRLVMNCTGNMVIDHKNGNRLDNRKSNLLITTHAENMLRRKKHSNNTSGITGIRLRTKSKNNTGNRFVATISGDNRIQESFNIDKHGYSYALALAYTWRKEKEILLGYKDYE
jgi:hypothetical protein